MAGIDHPAYPEKVAVPEAVRASLTESCLVNDQAEFTRDRIKSIDPSLTNRYIIAGVTQNGMINGSRGECVVRGIIDSIPLWSVLIVTVVVVFGSFELGFRLGARHRASRETADDAPINAVTGAHLGLLAFFLAFSFNMAASHYDKRKQVILDEVNAIATAYTRAQLVSNSAAGDEIQKLLRDYVEVRAALLPGANIMQIVKESERLQSEMWRQVVLSARSGAVTGADSLMARSVNVVMEVHKQRVAAGLHNRNPPSIWGVLYAVLVFSMVGMGYSFGIKGSRNYAGSFALALSFAIVLYMIADLDRPTGGLVISDQSAMRALQEQLE